VSGAGRSGARRTAPGRPDDGIAGLPELRPIAVRQPEPAATREHHLGERLTAYLDGELGHDARERVQAHLATCAECLAEADAARGVKQLLSRTEAPGPSGALMARLLAVAALPDDGSSGQGPGGGASEAELPPVSGPDLHAAEPTAPTLGGSRLTGGSFGRGASFGGNALGAGVPLPGSDPRAHQDGPRLWSVRRTGPSVADGERRRPAAVLPLSRPAVPRGRRLVVAAAGAFSVAAVTLGGFGSLGLASVAGDTPLDEPHAVNPLVPGNNSPVLPVTQPLSVDYQSHPGGGRPYDLVTAVPSGRAVSPVVNGRQLLP
jgi:anti-sigma factor RsiW